MQLLKGERIVPDEWVLIGDDDDLPLEKPVIVSLERWQKQNGELRQSNRPLGLRLRSDQSPELVADHLDRFAVIELEFPKFTDGRPYSYARMLRERFAYEGEVRAVGNVLRDQFMFMTRVGFDAFQIPQGADAQDYLSELKKFTVWYQEATDARRSAANLRKNGG